MSQERQKWIEDQLTNGDKSTEDLNAHCSKHRFIPSKTTRGQILARMNARPCKLKMAMQSTKDEPDNRDMAGMISSSGRGLADCNHSS